MATQRKAAVSATDGSGGFPAVSGDRAKRERLRELRRLRLLGLHERVVPALEAYARRVREEEAEPPHPPGAEERMVADPLSATVEGQKPLVAVPVRKRLRDDFDPYHPEPERSPYEDEDAAARTERAIIDRA